MENREIKLLDFDNGWRTVRFSEDRTARINPSDVNWLDRFLDFMKFLESKDFVTGIEKAVTNVQKNFGEISEGELSHEQYNTGDFYEVGKVMEEKLNKLFGSDICTPAFQGMNPLSPSSEGPMFFWLLLEALLPYYADVLESSSEAALKYANASKEHRIKRARKKING